MIRGEGGPSKARSENCGVLRAEELFPNRTHLGQKEVNLDRGLGVPVPHCLAPHSRSARSSGGLCVTLALGDTQPHL